MINKNKKRKELLSWSLINSLGVLVYVFVISQLLFSGEKIFGKMKTIWAPFTFLLLFVVSAAIVGLLIFGRVAHLYLNDHKKEAIKLLFCTIGWLFLATIIILLVLILIY